MSSLEQIEQLEKFLRFSGRRLAPVLSGVKPSLLLHVRNSQTRPERRCYDLLSQHDWRLRDVTGLEHLILSDNGQGLQILFFNRHALEAALKDRRCRLFLNRFGYTREFAGVDADLRLLTERFADNVEFPHEIGIFLGYPLKDVAAFIYRPGATRNLPGARWRIYGRQEGSLALMRLFEQAERLFDLLLQGVRVGSLHELKELFNNFKLEDISYESCA
ncbi:DUF3793 family protein [Lentisphaerota bacterium ZTH]|nr:DUF3793 family protein [Lentisphaerota bacterium]WET07371.1 DUF3793 family protein [Lentisphaerota bacterium ZTH]